MNKKQIIILWLLVLLIGAVFLQAAVTLSWTLSLDLFWETVRTGPDFLFNLVHCYRVTFFPERYFQHVFPTSVLIFSMAFLSIVAWCKKPGLHTLLGTIVAVWGMFGRFGMIFLAGNFGGPRGVGLGLSPVELFLVFSVPSCYILYCFLKSIKPEPTDTKVASPCVPG